jgi:hypothetical protein
MLDAADAHGSAVGQQVASPAWLKGNSHLGKGPAVAPELLYPAPDRIRLQRKGAPDRAVRRLAVDVRRDGLGLEFLAEPWPVEKRTAAGQTFAALDGLLPSQVSCSLQETGPFDSCRSASRTESYPLCAILLASHTNTEVPSDSAPEFGAAPQNGTPGILPWLGPQPSRRLRMRDGGN